MDAYLISNERGCVIAKGQNAPMIAKALNDRGMSGGWREFGTGGLWSGASGDMARRIVAKMLFPQSA
jgi:hypothetical protein